MNEILFLFIALLLSIIFQISFTENFLNIPVPPNAPEGIEYSSNKAINSNFENENLEEKVCFKKPVLKYDGVWTSHIDNKEDKGFRKWNFQEIEPSKYCSNNPSFNFKDEMIDGKYIDEDECIFETPLKFCCIDTHKDMC